MTVLTGPALKVVDAELEEQVEQIDADVLGLKRELHDIKTRLINIDHVKLTNIEASLEVVRDRTRSLYEELMPLKADVTHVKGAVDEVRIMLSQLLNPPAKEPEQP